MLTQQWVFVILEGPGVPEYVMFCDCKPMPLKSSRRVVVRAKQFAKVLLRLTKYVVSL